MHICNIFCNFAPELWYYIAMKAQIINKQTHKQMKKILYVLALGCVLMGCRSKLDLGNMDTQTQVQMGMALPVGSIHMSLKDILGEVKGLYIDSVNNKGVLTWKMDTTIARYYHQMNLKQYLSTAHKDLDVYEAIEKAIYPIPVPSISFKPEDIGLTDGLEFSMEFPLTLHLDGINKDRTYRERLDRAEIDSASFYTLFTSEDKENLPFKFEWIDSVILDLGDRFEFKDAAGNIDKTLNRIQIFPIDNTRSRIVDDSIFINIEKFALDMMINKHPKDYIEYAFNNVYDSCDFKIKLQFHIPKDTKISLNKNSKLSYDLGARFLDFSAIWGMFEPSKDMYDESVIDLGKNWGKLNFLTKATTPFYEPVVDAQLVTSIAGALELDSTYLFTVNMNGDTTFAWFSSKLDEKSRRWYHHQFAPWEYLGLNTPVGSVSDNMYVTFDRNEEKGQLHRLFSHMPQKLGYRFSVNFNRTNTGTPQIRITPNTTIRVNTKCILPFIFSEGVFVNYPDTAYDINLSKLSLDSIQNEMGVVDTLNATNLKLVMIAQNSIPMHVKVSMRCFDKNDQPIMDPKDPSKPFILFEKDTIELEPPTYTKLSNSQIVPTSDGKTIISTNLDKDELNTLPKINKIVYSAILDDESLQYAYNMGLVNVRLSEDQGVTMKIGVAGNIDAVLNFEKNNK